MRAGKKLLAAVLAGAFAVAAAGCGSVKFEPQEDSIFVKEDRTVVSAEFMEMDNSDKPTEWYNQDECKAFVEEQVKTYNRENGSADAAYAEESEEELRVSVEEFSVEGTTFKAVLHYASAGDYLAFNGTEYNGALKDLIIGTVQNGLDSGLDFSGMTDAEGNQVAAEDVADDADYTLVAVTGPTRMVVDGKVRYVSAGVTLVDENTVTTSEDTTEYVIFH